MDHTPQPPPLGNCPKCRTPMAPEIEFCTSCGAKVGEVASVDRPETVPPNRRRLDSGRGRVI